MSTVPPAPGDWILHVDLDQFLAAVEVLRRPELAGRPVVVGGDGDPTRPRQVVATASYEARAFGVRSGMPLRTAARRCPDAVFLPSDRAAYDAASAEVMATLRSFPVVVEVWGWDEAFVGATTDDPEALARDIKARVLDRTGLTLRGRHRRDPAAGQDGHRVRQARRRRPAHPRRRGCRRWATEPVTAIWGIGERTARRLAEAGIHTVHELAWRRPRRPGPAVRAPHRPVPAGARAGWRRRADRRRALGAAVAQQGDHLRARPHRPGRGARRRSAAWPREVTASVVAEGRTVTHVRVKVRTATFFTRTKIVEAARADHRPGRGGRAGPGGARPLRARPPHPPARACG